TVYYLRTDLTPLSQTVSISVGTGNEQGLLNVAADPDYAQNGYVYFYYTLPDGSGNRVVRRQVNVNVAGDTFSLGAEDVLATFLKSETTSPGENHNGGSMVFGESKNLFVGVGDGAGSDPVSQDASNPLGKIHRIRFDRSNPATPTLIAEDTVYALGLRNPFTLVVDDEGDLFMGDVGAGGFEEINCLYFQGENYGWPTCEGPCVPNNPNFVNPIHGYRHGDNTFNDQDPEDNSSGGESIMVAVYYTGDQYGGVFTNKLIYNEFFKGWVRLLTLNVFDQVTADEHIGHIEGLTGLQENPADGLLYGVTLFGGDRIVRMDLAQ
ncbi:PQQ-dependent sugar dehydrogenase, partial [bacterium]